MQANFDMSGFSEIKYLSKGIYGSVYEAINTLNGKKVALKHIKLNHTDCHRHLVYIIREAAILIHLTSVMKQNELKNFKSITKILQFILPKGAAEDPHTLEEIIIVLPHVDSSLKSLLTTETIMPESTLISMTF